MFDKDNFTLTQLQELFLYVTKNSKDIEYIDNLLEVYPNILDYMLADKIPDLSNVKYIKEKRYKSLKDKILRNKDLVSLCQSLEFVFEIKIVSKIREYFMNKLVTSNNINDFIISEIKNHPYDVLCSLEGIGFFKADKILLDANDKTNTLWSENLIVSEQRCISFLTYFLYECLNGSTIIPLKEIYKQMMYKYNLQPLIKVLDKVKYNERFVLINNSYLMLRKIYDEEKNIAKFIRECLTPINQNKWKDVDYKKYIHLDTFTLSDKQQLVLQYICENQLVLLNGFAGTGKSNTMKALIDMLINIGKTYLILAPTARAAKNVAEYTGKTAYTIHYYLCKYLFPEDNSYQYHKLSDDVDLLDNQQEINYQYSLLDEAEGIKIGYDVLIIDESSMMSVTLFNTLLQYIDPVKTKILLVGDSYQLPSIQYGNLYHDLLRISDIPSIFLDEIFRYKEDGLINVATNVRLGNIYLKENKDTQIGESYNFYTYRNHKDLINKVLNKYLELVDKYSKEDVIILTPKNIGNTGTNLINSCVQRIINPIEWCDTYHEIKIDNMSIKFKENDRVMNIKNNYKAVIVDEYGFPSTDTAIIINGQIGIVKEVRPNNQLVVNFEGIDILFEGTEAYNLRLAYCFTVHKSQGSQFKSIIYLTTAEDFYMINSNLLYVGITRAINECHHFGDMRTINNKIGIRENLKRNTTLVQQYKKVI